MSTRFFISMLALAGRSSSAGNRPRRTGDNTTNRPPPWRTCRPRRSCNSPTSSRQRRASDLSQALAENYRHRRVLSAHGAPLHETGPVADGRFDPKHPGYSSTPMIRAPAVCGSSRSNTRFRSTCRRGCRRPKSATRCLGPERRLGAGRCTRGCGSTARTACSPRSIRKCREESPCRNTSSNARFRTRANHRH